MQNSPISFGTNIKFETRNNFINLVKDYNHSITSPLTAEGIVRSSQVYTPGITTCSAGGIIVKSEKEAGFDVVMFHIDPDNQSNVFFEPIKKAIYDKLNGCKPLQAFLLGSYTGIDNSPQMFANFEKFIKEMKIPLSKFKGSPLYDKLHIAYDGNKDELTVFSSAVEKANQGFSLNEVVKHFEDVEISSDDKVI